MNDPRKSSGAPGSKDQHGAASGYKARVEPNIVRDAVFQGGGAAGELLRSIDWANHPMGPVEAWPERLRTSLNICLASRYPICILWGTERTYFYNDAYTPIVGSKHPRALGASHPEVWPEIWDRDIRPILESVESTGEASWSDDLLLVLHRHGYDEECYFGFSFAPILNEEGNVGGVFTAITETTMRVIGDRRLRTLRDLTARTADAKSAEQVCALAAEVLAQNPYDIPFALFYLLEGGENQSRLVNCVGIDPDHPNAPPVILLSKPGLSKPGLSEPGALTEEATEEATEETTEEPKDFWSFATVADTGRPIILTGLAEGRARLPAPLPGGPWPEPSHTAMVLPIARAGQSTPYGFLVCGVSPRRAVDDDYQSFLSLVANQVGGAVSNALAYEEERKRAEALAELDRAKTTFFSNISHEFRTPLTLLLGPIDEILSKPDEETSQERRELLNISRRNGRRLLTLVNALLEFSRIEAGRLQARYKPTDLSAYTAELGSVFRAAIEKAGMRLIMDCPPLPEPAYVDREMWEKIVLNLLSNAFKYTLEGEIKVSLRAKKGSAVLLVQDTGIGIPESELPNVFNRFHRVEGAGGRTQEGAGIGLALVQEFTRLHGGTVGVESVSGKGSVFTVTIPLGAAHLPADRIADAPEFVSSAVDSRVYLDEALRWSSSEESDLKQEWIDGEAAPASPGSAATPVARILLADDNADMRNYVRRLLGAKYDVIAVVDGREALQAAIECQPNLVLADVMMPNLDGFGLLKALRENPWTSSIPVIMLSARAGEESRIEGMDAGADDYLIKPFSARELLARVGSQLAMASLRSEALQRERLLRAEAEMLNEVTRDLTSELDLQTLLQKVTDYATRMTDAKFGAFFYNTLNELGESYLLYTLSGAPREAFERFGAPRNTAVFEPTFRGEGAIRLDDVTKDPRFGKNAPHYGMPKGHLPVRSYLAVPVILRSGEVAGGLFFGHPEPGVFTERAERAALAVAAQAAIAIDNAQLYGAAKKEVRERIAAERSLRESEERLRLATQTGKVGVWDWDIVANHVSWTDSLYEIHGVKPEEFDATVEGFAKWIHPEDREGVSQAIQHALQGLAPYEIEFRAIRPNGEVIWLQTGARVLRDGDRPIRMLGATVDISRLKQVEDELRESDRRKDEFLATLAHELRNPLAPIRNAMQIIELAGDNLEIVEQARLMMERQFVQMVRLIDDLLDLSRISRGKIELRKERAELATIVRSALETSQPIIEQAGHELILNLPPDPIVVDADVTRLAQVFANLLNNAAKYTERGGRIWLTVTPRKDEVLVSVKDTGVGIPSNMLSKVFEMFAQVDQSLEKAQGGLGIGLSITKRLVEMHGGAVDASSEGQGKGSEFTVRLPLPIPSTPGSESGGATDEQSANPAKRRILVADDNEDSVASMALMLKILGNDVRTAADGLEAVAVAESFQPSLILLDIGMPKLNGYDACRRIREQPWGRDIIIVALTGWGQEDDKRRAREAGFSHHLVKPVGLDAIRKLLDEL
jgi:PAS domain S-box-containing protein